MFYFHCINNSLSQLINSKWIVQFYNKFQMDRSVLVAFLLLSFLLATEMGPMSAEAKTCETQSSKFKGMCMSSTNCASVCKSEPGFDGGHCRSFRRQCVCTKPC
ncbi:hypothetical protein Goshw_028518 [Gossypium schwendimanii]|uniref:Invertebrate defensins family profile domain-containing protein n=2 Tax=Gossypium schwendimanii TaxID=34291 RepID=A0A7J9KVG4_GOSSC|nr:hypothetical protein [Gossypium schwendimanii]